MARQGATDFTNAYGWRRNKVTGELEWTRIPTCVRCQDKYSRNQFPKDNTYDPGGRWTR
ncbi:hypothetical protein GCM10023096_40240 [Nonomuraea ferruginea]